MTTTEPALAFGSHPDADLAPPLAAGGWRAVVRGVLAHPPGLVGLDAIVLLTLVSFVGPMTYHTDQRFATNSSCLGTRTSSHPYTDALARGAAERVG